MLIKVTIRIRENEKFPTVVGIEGYGGLWDPLTDVLQSPQGFGGSPMHYMNLVAKYLRKNVRGSSWQILCLDTKNETWVSTFIRPGTKVEEPLSTKNKRKSRFDREPVI